MNRAIPPDHALVAHSCRACRGPIHRPYFQLERGYLCSVCLENLSVSEMQLVVHASEVRGVLHL